MLTTSVGYTLFFCFLFLSERSKDCLPLWYCRTLVDDWILVDEDEIASAVREMAEHCHKIIEGSAGVALAAFLKDRARDRSLPAVVVACGSNIGLENLAMLYGRS